MSARAIDQRILANDGEIYNNNQVVALEAGNHHFRNLELNARLEYNRHQLLDEVPLLYTRLTASRFKNDALFFTFGARYAFE